jgi:hypothetical protein
MSETPSLRGNKFEGSNLFYHFAPATEISQDERKIGRDLLRAFYEEAKKGCWRRFNELVVDYLVCFPSERALLPIDEGAFDLIQKELYELRPIAENDNYHEDFGCWDFVDRAKIGKLLFPDRAHALGLNEIAWQGVRKYVESILEVSVNELNHEQHFVQTVSEAQLAFPNHIDTFLKEHPEIWDVAMRELKDSIGKAAKVDGWHVVVEEVIAIRCLFPERWIELRNLIPDRIWQFFHDAFYEAKDNAESEKVSEPSSMTLAEIGGNENERLTAGSSYWAVVWERARQNVLITASEVRVTEKGFSIF